VKNLQTGAVTLVSANSSGDEGNATSDSASISADGRYVAFASGASNLVPGDTNGDSDVFVKDLQTGAVTLVSRDPAGNQGNLQSYDPSISADGRYVAFTSHASNLVSGDTNGIADVFVKDLHTSKIIRISGATGAEGNGNSFFPRISADGRSVTFTSSASNLVPDDTNGNADIFIAPVIFDSNDAPAVTANTGSRLAADQFLDTITTGELAASDPDSDAFVFKLTDLPDAGELLVGGVALGLNGTFTQVDIDQGRLQYLAAQHPDAPSANQTLTDTFSFTLSDGEATTAATTFAISLDPYANVQAAKTNGAFVGMAGRDYQHGTAGLDPMTGGAGHDTLAGNAGADLMHGADGNDRMYGGLGNDLLYGDHGNDYLVGGEGTDLMHGGAGNDLMRSDRGDGDRMWGGSGDDTFTFRPGFGKDHVEDFSTIQHDMIDLRGFGYASFADLADDLGKVVSAGGDTILKLTDTDWLTLENVRTSQLQESDFLFV
jgi:Ca2+-binding RTX toxin-like protein